MAKANTAKTKIKLHGKTLPTSDRSIDASRVHFTLTAAYKLDNSRSIEAEHEIEIGDNDYIELTFQDDTVWFGDRDTLHTFFPEIEAATRAGGVPHLPVGVASDDSARGLVSQAVLKLFKKYTRTAVQSTMTKLANSLEQKSLEGRQGLYAIDGDFKLTPFKKQDSTKPLLLFIHGTASSTTGSFVSLKTNTLWTDIQERYGSNILAFEHQTLTKSPLENLLELLRLLPDSSQPIDIITHSRGGLVGDLLVRFSENPSGFPAASLDLLKEEKRSGDLKSIQEIGKLMSTRQLKVGKLIRVACPARGTSLLGKRTDVFFNVLINLINVSSPVLAPIVETLKALISQALETRNDAEVLPGLEAMNPESVFLKALNTASSYADDIAAGFNNRLLVISGNSKFSVSLNGLKVLLTKFFFKWGPNDLVVDTPSMYQGARRKAPVQYFLDDGSGVNHFSYFSNKTTQDAIGQALFSKEDRVAAFKEMDIENLGALQRGIFGLEGGKLAIRKASGQKPIVLLLPGIMGSFLEDGKKSLWINYLSFAFGGLTRLRLDGSDKIEATGLIKTAYKDLVAYLSATYDVEVFPFDWRKSIPASGRLLHQRILELQQLKQPILLVGHSMGGLVIRELALQFEATWQWLNAQTGFKTVLLGTPWMGSFRIPNVLAGKDSIIKQLDTIDFAHSRTTLIDMFSKFPGLLGLLPVMPNDTDFGNKKVWDQFIQASGMDWEAPDQQLLADIAAFKSRVNEGIATLDHSNIIYVAGKDEETVDGYKIENGQLLFSVTAEGDQSVTWATGIPQKLNRETALYYTRATHGGLSLKKYLFQGIKDLLDRGTTQSPEFSRKPLPQLPTGRTISREVYNFENTEESIEANLLGLGQDFTEDTSTLPILKVSVTKGDMIYAAHPLLIGHFANDGIYGAEAVANKYLNNSLYMKHHLGIYPGDVGTHNFFECKDGGFKGVLVLGMGQAENLNAYQITKTTEQATSDYLLSYCRKQLQPQKNKIGLSSLIIGTDYGGLPLESSCRAIMQGIVNANKKVMAVTGMEDLYVDELEFIELFEDKSISCFYSLAGFINGNSDGMNIAWKEKRIKTVPGGRKRLLSDASYSWWQRLSIIATEQQLSKKPVREKVLSYYSSTNNAREEKKELHHNLQLIDTLLNDISIGKNWSADKAKAIFELLIPTEFKENIRRNSPIIWVLDKFTASFPWELLQTGGDGEKPLCVTAGMIRQLATENYKSRTPIKGNNVLIIGDPDLNGYSGAGQLPGAAREAGLVYELLKGKNELSIDNPLIRASSDELLTALYKQEYKILHLAGHGFFDADDPGNCGMVIGKTPDGDSPLFLTPHHINQLPNTPEFVFVNCCFLGRINPYAEQLSAKRHELAANIGTQLIENGVKAVVVAGWEVDDGAALRFAEILYEKMLSNYNFGAAVQEARRVVYNEFPNSNTWGAFQCYGQQHYTLNLNHSNQDSPYTYDIPQSAENDLDNLLSNTEVAFYEDDYLMQQLRKISDGINRAGFRNPELRQKEAMAYTELNDYEQAEKLYNELFKTEDASFDVKALERYQRIRIRKEISYFFSHPGMKAPERTAILDVIEDGIANLKNLLLVWETGERYALIASAYKRKGLVLTAPASKLKAMEQATGFYYKAYNKLGSSYSFSNWVILETLIQKYKKQSWGQTVVRDAKRQRLLPLTEINRQLADLKKTTMTDEKDKNYWNMSEILDILLCSYFLKPTEAEFTAYAKQLRSLWKHEGSKNKQQMQKDNLKILADYARFAGLNPIAEKLLSIT
ncbi:hypothetical protein GCM10027051_10160 [Niabella terrae]